MPAERVRFRGQGLLGRMTGELQQTPLSTWHATHGARMVEFSGWLMPVQYRSIVAEHQATRTGVGLFDISHMGRFEFRGPQASDCLDRLLTRSASALKPNSIRYALITNDAGGILDDVLVYRLADSDGPYYLLVVNAGNRQKIGEWIQQQRREQDDVEIRDVTLETAMIAVQGPQAQTAMGSIVDPAATKLRNYTGVVSELGGCRATVSRTGYTGEDGFEIIVPNTQAQAVWESLLATPVGAQPAGLGARDTLRLEAAMPLYGHELSEEINPFEAGLQFAVQLQGRDFPGRDRLAEISGVTPSRKRVGLTLEGRRVPREGHPVLANGDVIGIVTSGTFSPTLERPIAMAYVASAQAGEGDRVDVEIRGKKEAARIVPLPFYQRSS